MSVYELKELFTDDSQLIRIYDTDADENIYEGEFCDVPEYLEDAEICSIDSVYKIDFDGYITINIETENY